MQYNNYCTHYLFHALDDEITGSSVQGDSDESSDEVEIESDVRN